MTPLTWKSSVPEDLNDNQTVFSPVSLMYGHFKTTSSVELYLLKELCISEDLNNDYAESITSVMEIILPLQGISQIQQATLCPGRIE